VGGRTHGDLFELEFGRRVQPVAVEVTYRGS
jgi:hypothetical protein